MSDRRSWLVPISLFLFALLVRLVAIAWVPFPPTEGSLYYLDVARNLVEGHGLTTNALWSYANPPFSLPRPAFDLWLPLASLVAAVPMLIGGTAHQVGPTRWRRAGSLSRAPGLGRGPGSGRDGWPRWAPVEGIGDHRGTARRGPGAVPGGHGGARFERAVRGPGHPRRAPHLRACCGRQRWQWPSTLADRAWSWVSALGLTYLARQEVVWIGLALLILAVPTIRTVTPGGRARHAVRLLGPVVVGGLLLVVPWLVRQQLTFGGGATAQALENMFLLRNEQIFAVHDRPTLAGWLGQGIGAVAVAPLRAAGTQLIDALLVGAFPVGLVGLLSIIGLRRRASLRHPTALVVLLLAGGITFLATALLFPVATLWGTFAHASGPLLIGLIVATVLGVDGLMTRISIARHWERINVIVGPAALLALAIPIALVQLASVAGTAGTFERRLAAVRVALDVSGEPTEGPIMSDHPMSLSWVLGRPVLVVPDDPPGTLAEIARATGATTLVMFDDRGRYPEALLVPAAPTCLADDPATDRPGRGSSVVVPHRPCLRDAMTEQGGTARTSPYTRPTMETGIRGDRRADVDALYTEAQLALTQSANRLRALTERLREVHADELTEARRVPDPGATAAETAGRDQQAMDTARAGQLLSRLELITRDLEDGWRFLERGQDGDWSASARGAADQLQIERPANLVEARLVLEAQEQERTRLAEELHDGPAQTLSNAVFRVRIVERALRSDPVLADSELADLGSVLERETRTAAGLHPAAAAVPAGIGRPRLGAHGRRQADGGGDGHRGRRGPDCARGGARRARTHGRAAGRPGGAPERAQALRGDAGPGDHAPRTTRGAAQPRLVGPGGP